jgi:hypothetical protein
MAGADTRAMPKSRIGCKVALATMSLVLVAVRTLLRCPANASPPDPVVRIGQPGWEVVLRKTLVENGYAHVPGLLKRAEVEALRSIANDYCYGSPRKALPLSYGGYSVPGFLDIPEFSAAKWLPEDARLHNLLRATFNGTDYRFATHNDVGCDFVGVWHKDVLRGKVAKYQRCDIWSPDTEGEKHEIYKVMFYLQDHDRDEQAIKVIPGSHVIRNTPWETGYVALHPLMGDTVIFDQRLSHAGNTYYNAFGSGRLFMQVGFGRKNRFTDEFEQGTTERQQSLQARMLQQKTEAGWPTFAADVKFSVLGAIFSALPPRLLNYFSDADVKAHLGRSCATPLNSPPLKSEL